MLGMRSSDSFADDRVQIFKCGRGSATERLLIGGPLLDDPGEGSSSGYASVLGLLVHYGERIGTHADLDGTASWRAGRGRRSDGWHARIVPHLGSAGDLELGIGFVAILDSPRILGALLDNNWIRAAGGRA